MYTGTLVEFLNIGGSEMMLILGAVLLLFGGKKMPELARGLGKGIREFKDASEGVKREIHRNINSVGIVDDINDIVNDNSRHHPTDEPAAAAEITGHHEPINLNKETVTVDHQVDDNSRIETDKTKLN
ncbi:twin-arginine translocase TatA/TatE family subunit [Pedobacter sp. MC2016-24]|uniref:Sec-independent protein translocase subunit TatA/TatB n=1 Tax=Pedobacter sp. MC2016-24 TaxID=2780090 RepID=UPI001881B764|nr:twin-arginine translocase TatA/TatE family subunit [Pedobacter sp. MC2016-24]MBE9599622.1 twin-arginine translocase TatA/TatE family subunit [Pedobacter sp. MC2016-24]